MSLKIYIPYGNAYASLHFAQGNEEGDVTLCGRNCYGWSYAREAEPSDLESAYSCKRCLKKLAENKSLLATN